MIWIKPKATATHGGPSLQADFGIRPGRGHAVFVPASILEPQARAQTPARWRDRLFSPQAPLWQLGFRPFYLLAALLACLSVPLWSLQFAGLIHPLLPGVLGHAHEMLMGYALAVILGFLFTAGQNWTGQPTPKGRALMAVASLWLAARLLAYVPMMDLSVFIPMLAPSAASDGPTAPNTIALLLAGAANLATAWLGAWGLWRALRTSDKRRNHFFVALLVAMGLASLLLHLHLALGDQALQNWHLSERAVGLLRDVVLFMIVVMGGRVIPMFSNNGVPDLRATRDPWVERVALGSTLALLAVDTLQLPQPVVLATLLVGAAAHLHRLLLWQPWGTRKNPLVWSLHLAYAWIPVHLLLRLGAQSSWFGAHLTQGLATHALTIGSIGGMTLAMMTRTALGHTGRPLRAGKAETWCYGTIHLSALLRVGVPMLAPAWLLGAVHAAALAWSLAFGLYLWAYLPRLTQARADGQPG